MMTFTRKTAGAGHTRVCGLAENRRELQARGGGLGQDRWRIKAASWPQSENESQQYGCDRFHFFAAMRAGSKTRRNARF